MPVRYILSSVWIRLSIISPLSIIQYVGLYVFSLLISLVMIKRIYILCLIIIIISEIWNFTHCLGLGHEPMVSVVCLSIFLLAGRNPRFSPVIGVTVSRQEDRKHVQHFTSAGIHSKTDLKLNCAPWHRLPRTIIKLIFLYASWIWLVLIYP